MTTQFYSLASISILALATSFAALACSSPDDGSKAGTTTGDKPKVEQPKPREPQRPETPPPTDTAPVPFSLELSARTIEGLPGLHSTAGAMHEGSIVLMSGRRNGMHAFPPERKAQQIQAFPRSEANESIWVIDPAAGTLRGSAGIDKLPDAIAAQLRATNTQSIESNGWLYIVGGYGYAGESMKTLDTVTAIDLDALVEAVVGSQPLDEAFASAHIAQASHPALAITGGELVEFGSGFLLVFGNQFDGLYTPGESVAVQTYSDSVRSFQFTLDSSSGSPKLSVAFPGSIPAVGTQQDPEGPYHRRDGVIEPALDPATGTPRIAAYGGVFKGGRMEGYVTPVYIDADSTNPLGFSITEDTSATQLLSHYDCGVIQLYGASNKVMYTTLFGGISQFYWDAASSSLKRDPVDLSKGIDGLPFIDSISTLRVASTSTGTSTAQYLHEGQSFPPATARPQCPGTDGGTIEATLLGAETRFFPAPDVPSQNDVLLVDQITSPAVIGYLVGGIAATAPYSANGPTCASNQIYTVTLVPGVPTRTAELTAP